MDKEYGFKLDTGIAKRKKELDILDKLRNLKSRITDLERAATVEFGAVPDYTGPKVVVYAGTENCYKDMELSAKTLLANSKVDKIYFLIDTDEFPTKLPEIIEAINVHDQAYYYPWCLSLLATPSYMTMMRHALYDMFPQYDRILWLDIDTLVVDDISELFNIPLGDYYYFAAAEEDRHYLQYTSSRKILDKPEAYHDLIIDNDVYFNDAVLLENLKLIREEIGEELVNHLNNYLVYYCDQSLLNNSCRDRIYRLSNVYNTSHCTNDMDFRKAKILHMSNARKTIEMESLIGIYDEVSFEQIMEWRAKREKAGVLSGKK